MRRRTRTVNAVLPDDLSVLDGLAYSLWLPPAGADLRGGVVVLHGAGSCKENHHDFARALRAAGFAALVFDQRGHGESAGPMDARALDDVVAVTKRLRERMIEHAPLRTAPAIALRGSSMGGYLAILAAPAAQARAVVAICPATGGGLMRGLAANALGFEGDRPALEHLLSQHDLPAALAELPVPVLLLHAEGDEQVPVEHSRELGQRMSNPHSRLVVVPGGHHRSVQHDPELNALTLRFLERTLGED